MIVVVFFIFFNFSGEKEISDYPLNEPMVYDLEYASIA